MKNLMLVLVAAVLIACQAGCSGDNSVNPRLGCDCDGGDIYTVDLGATCTIRLVCSYPSSGYKWEFIEGFDEGYIELESYSMKPVDPDDDREGVPYYQIWTYETKKRGRTCATLEYTQDGVEKSIILIIE